MIIEIKEYDNKSQFQKYEKEIFLNKLIRAIGFKDISEFKEYVDLLLKEKDEHVDFRNSFGEILLALVSFFSVVDDELGECIRYSINEYGNIDKTYLWDCKDSIFNAIDDIMKMILVAIDDLGYTPDPRVLELMKKFISRFGKQ